MRQNLLDYLIESGQVLHPTIQKFIDRQQADCPLDLKNFEAYPCSRGDADCDICKAYVAEEREREG